MSFNVTKKLAAFEFDIMIAVLMSKNLEHAYKDRNQIDVFFPGWLKDQPASFYRDGRVSFEIDSTPEGQAGNWRTSYDSQTHPDIDNLLQDYTVAVVQDFATKRAYDCTAVHGDASGDIILEINIPEELSVGGSTFV